MSVHLIDLTSVKSAGHAKIVTPMDRFLRNVQEGENLELCVDMTIRYLELLHLSGEIHVAAEVVDVVSNLYYGYYRLARTGCQTLSSTWAKKMYPDAEHELFITVVDRVGDPVHVLLLYV